MLGVLFVILIGLVFGFFAYSWITRAFPSKILGTATSVVTSGSTYAISFYSNAVHVFELMFAGAYGTAGYAFLAVWGSVLILWLVQGLNGWAHDRPFLKSMIE